MAVARKDAQAFLERDPTMECERGRAVRLLLWLMEQDRAIRLISAG
jgi:ATP-dependent DNA helicase RecG